MLRKATFEEEKVSFTPAPVAPLKLLQVISFQWLLHQRKGTLQISALHCEFYFCSFQKQFLVLLLLLLLFAAYKSRFVVVVVVLFLFSASKNRL